MTTLEIKGYWNTTKVQRLKGVEPSIRRALEVDGKNLGPENPNFAFKLNKLAELLFATNRFKEAKLLFRRALEIDEKILGPKHPITQTIRANLKSLHNAMNVVGKT
jgi:tetratricopeptide (TPR) repeat protein